MKLLSTCSSICSSMVLGLGMVALGAPAKADAPGIFYAWRPLSTSVAQCIVQAETAMVEVGLEEISVEATNVAGYQGESTALFICIDSGAETTVMVIVSGEDEEEAIAIREALKGAF